MTNQRKKQKIRQTGMKPEMARRIAGWGWEFWAVCWKQRVEVVRALGELVIWAERRRRRPHTPSFDFQLQCCTLLVLVLCSVVCIAQCTLHTTRSTPFNIPNLELHCALHITFLLQEIVKNIESNIFQTAKNTAKTSSEITECEKHCIVKKSEHRPLLAAEWAVFKAGMTRKLLALCCSVGLLHMPPDDEDSDDNGHAND